MRRNSNYTSKPQGCLYGEKMGSTPTLFYGRKKVEQNKFHVVFQLAAAFLAIPATSAPSEKKWSWAAQVLTIKRSRLDSDVASGIMFVDENAEVLKKHYDATHFTYSTSCEPCSRHVSQQIPRDGT